MNINKKTIIIISAVIIAVGLVSFLVIGMKNKNENSVQTENNKTENVTKPSKATDEKSKTSPFGNQSLCETACANYVMKCISLVPNADSNLINESISSCYNECQKWNNEKANCILNALDCESMTNVCGL